MPRTSEVCTGVLGSNETWLEIYVLLCVTLVYGSPGDGKGTGPRVYSIEAIDCGDKLAFWARGVSEMVENIPLAEGCVGTPRRKDIRLSYGRGYTRGFSSFIALFWKIANGPLKTNPVVIHGARRKPLWGSSLSLFSPPGQETF